MTMDNNDINTLNILMQEVINQLVKKFEDSGSSQSRTSALNDIRDILQDIKDQTTNSSNRNNSGGTNNHSSQNNNTNTRGMASQVANALRNHSRTGNDSILSAMSREQSLLMRQEERAKKDGESTRSLLSTISNSVKDGKSLASRVSSQMKTGAIEIPGISMLVKSMGESGEMYRKMVSAGQDFGGSLIKMREVANRSGLTMEQFTKSVTAGSQGIKLIGPDAFSTLAKSVNDSVSAMGDMAMTGDQLNDSMSDYIEGMRRAGRLNELNSKDFNSSFRSMVFNAEELAHTMGISRDQALKQLNEAKAAPDIMLLKQGMDPAHAGNMDIISAISKGLGPDVQKIMASAMYTARTGLGPTSEVNSMLSRSSTGQSAYVHLTEAQQRLQNANTDEDRKRAEHSIFQALTEMKNGISAMNAINAQAGVSGFGQTVNLFGELSAANLDQMQNNINTGPRNSRESSGTDAVTAPTLGVNHAQQTAQVAWQTVGTSMIKANAPFIGATVNAYNRFTTDMSKYFTQLGNMLSSWSGSLTGNFTGIMNWFTNHSLALLGAMVAGHFAVGGVKSLVTRGLGRAARGLAGRGASASESLLARGGATAAGEAATGGLLAGSRAIPLLGAALGIGATAYGWNNQRNNLNSQLASHQLSQQQYDHQMGNNNWSAGGSLDGMLLGGGLGLVAGPLGAAIGASAGNWLGGKIGGAAYEWTHGNASPSRQNTTQQPVNATPNNNQQSNGETDPQAMRKEYTLEDVVNSLQQGFHGSSDQMDSLIRAIGDLNRSIKQTSGVVQP